MENAHKSSVGTPVDTVLSAKTVDDMIESIEILRLHETYLSRDLTDSHSIFEVQGRLRALHLTTGLFAPKESKNSRYYDIGGHFDSTFVHRESPEIPSSCDVFRHNIRKYTRLRRILSCSTVNNLCK